MPEAPLTVDEVAELMRVSSKTVMRAIAAGHLEASQLTQGRGGWRIRLSAVDAWLELRSNRTRLMRSPADVERIEPQLPAPRRPSKRSPSGRGGTLVA